MQHSALRRTLRGGVSFTLMCAILWAVSASAAAQTSADAARSFAALRLSGAECALALLRFERGDFFDTDALSLPAAMALHVSPLLLAGAPESAAEQPPLQPEAPAAPAAPSDPAPAGEPDGAEAPTALPPITVRDNGVHATTLRPSDPSGYLVRGSVYVHNTSAAALSLDDLSGPFASTTGESPQVLIVHTHGCEAYTMPAGEVYEPSDDHRTLDEAYNVLRVGDEIARVLTDAGFGVLHDRTLHDYPSYSGAYNRSLATIAQYREQYPSLVYILDIHRDAVTDADGNQYKLICAEEPNAAQLEFVLGSDGGGAEHARWRENLRLACAVQETILADHPTLMRPIVVRNSRYNQQVSTGSLLLEVGTAGNSLEEALVAARLFAEGFARTVKG